MAVELLKYRVSGIPQHLSSDQVRAELENMTDVKLSDFYYIAKSKFEDATDTIAYVKITAGEYDHLKRLEGQYILGNGRECRLKQMSMDDKRNQPQPRSDYLQRRLRVSGLADTTSPENDVRSQRDWLSGWKNDEEAVKDEHNGGEVVEFRITGLPENADPKDIREELENMMKAPFVSCKYVAKSRYEDAQDTIAFVKIATEHVKALLSLENRHYLGSMRYLHVRPSARPVQVWPAATGSESTEKTSRPFSSDVRVEDQRLSTTAVKHLQNSLSTNQHKKQSEMAVCVGSTGGSDKQQQQKVWKPLFLLVPLDSTEESKTAMQQMIEVFGGLNINTTTPKTVDGGESSRFAAVFAGSGAPAAAPPSATSRSVNVTKAPEAWNNAGNLPSFSSQPSSFAPHRMRPAAVARLEQQRQRNLTPTPEKDVAGRSRFAAAVGSGATKSASVIASTSTAAATAAFISSHGPNFKKPTSQFLFPPAADVRSEKSMQRDPSSSATDSSSSTFRQQQFITNNMPTPPRSAGGLGRANVASSVIGSGPPGTSRLSKSAALRRCLPFPAIVPYGKPYEGYVSWVDEYGNVFVQPRDHELICAYDVELRDAKLKKLTEVACSLLELGQVVVCESEGALYRARLCEKFPNANTNKFRVFYIDWGMYDECFADELMELPLNMAIKTCGVFKVNMARLHELYPVVEHMREQFAAIMRHTYFGKDVTFMREVADDDNASQKTNTTVGGYADGQEEEFGDVEEFGVGRLEVVD